MTKIAGLLLDNDWMLVPPSDIRRMMEMPTFKFKFLAFRKES